MPEYWQEESYKERSPWALDELVQDSEGEQGQVTLAAGTRTRPAAELTKRGFTVYVRFWDQAGGERKAAATKFVSLNPHLSLLNKK